MNKIFITLLFTYILLLCSCKEDEAVLEKIIRLEKPQEESLSADNYSTLMVRAIIPKEAAVSRRAVSFITDAGLFSNDSTQILLQADANGYADAFIHSSKPGKAKVTATILTYSVNKVITFTPIDIDQAIRFEDFTQNPVEADNLSERLIKIVIDKNTPLGKRKVTVTTDLGSFTNQQSTIDLLADKDGVAQTYIKSDSPGKAKVTATANSFQAEAFLSFVKPNIDNIIHFIDMQSVSIPADGVSTIEIKTLINNAVTGAQRKVSFVSDLGTFPNGTKTEEVTSDVTGTSRILLKSNLPGIAFVTATHKSVTISKAFTFERAFPEKMSLNTDFALKAGITNKITIQAVLTRAIGKPGADFEIEYEAKTKENPAKDIGLFRNASLSNSNGQAQIDFSGGNTAYRGEIIITARVKEKPSVTASILVVITD